MIRGPDNTNRGSYTGTVRNKAVPVREKGSLEEAREIEASDSHSIFKHILRNVLGLIIIIAPFSGLGVTASAPARGIVRSDGQSCIAGDRRLMINPGSAIALTVFAIDVSGDRI